MPLNEPPLGWGKTNLTEYFENARSNVIATKKARTISTGS